MMAWHFGAEKMRDGRDFPPDGVKLVYNEQLVMCESGLHASERIIDALQYAPGNTIFRVECGGKIECDTDKIVCTERTILWRIDGEKVLQEFARWCALEVLHLWNASEIIVRHLKTGDENIRAAAGDAAWSAAEDAAWSAARSAARVAAWAAAWATAGDAARVAAWAAAWATQNAKLTAMVEEAHNRMVPA